MPEEFPVTSAEASHMLLLISTMPFCWKHYWSTGRCMLNQWSDATLLPSTAELGWYLSAWHQVQLGWYIKCICHDTASMYPSQYQCHASHQRTCINLYCHFLAIHISASSHRVLLMHYNHCPLDDALLGTSWVSLSHPLVTTVACHFQNVAAILSQLHISQWPSSSLHRESIPTHDSNWALWYLTWLFRANYVILPLDLWTHNFYPILKTVCPCRLVQS